MVDADATQGASVAEQLLSLLRGADDVSDALHHASRGRRVKARCREVGTGGAGPAVEDSHPGRVGDRKSTRLNSSHTVISYAVFCLKKKRIKMEIIVVE